MEKKKVGRPPKKNAIKAGQLSANDCRFTFIAEKSTVNNIKKIAADTGVSIKDFMKQLLKPVDLKGTSKVVKPDKKVIAIYKEDFILKVLNKDKK